MPIDMKPNTNEIKITTVLSKTAEVVAIINILADRKHHEYIKDWIDSTYSALSLSSKKMLRLISQLPYQGIEFFEIILDTRIFDDIETLSKKIMNYEDTQFTYILTGEQIKMKKIKEIRENKYEFEKFIDDLPWLYRGGREIYEWIINNTDDFKLSLVKLISEIASPLFEKKFNSLETEYKHALQDISSKLNKGTPLQLANYIMNKVIEDNSEICEYIFLPSYFINPHYVMAFNKYARMFLYDIREEAAVIRKETGENLSSKLKILSDKTRLEILRLLILQPCSGTTLSNRLNLTNATISHHIELLRSVSLITEIRDKNTKYYSSNVTEIDELIKSLQNYLYNK